MAISIFLNVHGRKKVVGIAEGTVSKLREAFARICVGDPILRVRVTDHWPVFLGVRMGQEVELEEYDSLRDREEVSVRFEPVPNVSTDG